jgi:uncharacterized protein involved in exopolysaccharide biosynthesis
VTSRREIESTLAQAFEQARIDQVRDTPVITIVEPPIVPAVANSRGIIRNAVLGLIVGLMGFVAWAFVRNVRAPPGSTV